MQRGRRKKSAQEFADTLDEIAEKLEKKYHDRTARMLVPRETHAINTE